MAEFEFNAQPRPNTGRGPARRLRAEGFIPATIYGAKKNPEAISLRQKDVLKALQNDAIFSHILTLKVGEEKQKVIIKALQRYPAQPKLMHMDFQRINTKEKITIKVPIHFHGEEECPGVKAGGVISHIMTDLEIRCLPKDLPESFNVDVSHLEIDHAVHLSEIKLPPGVELAHIEITEESDPPVVSVHEPKVTQEDIEAEAREAALAEEAAAEAAEVAGAEAEAAEKETEKEEGEPAKTEETTEEKPEKDGD